MFSRSYKSPFSVLAIQFLREFSLKSFDRWSPYYDLLEQSRFLFLGYLILVGLLDLHFVFLPITFFSKGSLILPVVLVT